MVGYGIEGALKFGFYELFKPVFGHLTPNAFVNFLLASVVAGAVASVVLCPCEDARIRMVSQPAFATGLVDALVKLVQEDGWQATFKGLGAMLAKQVPYTMTKQVRETRSLSKKMSSAVDIDNFFWGGKQDSVTAATPSALACYTVGCCSCACCVPCALCR